MKQFNNIKKIHRLALNRMMPLALILIVLISMQCRFKDDDPGYGDIDSALMREMEIEDIPSLSVCIFKGEEIVWKKAYGHADLQSGSPADTSHIYMVGSVSKLVVVTAVMQLAEQGLVDLDQDINRYLPFSIRHPDYPAVPISLRMLLTHTSSLARPSNEIPNYNIICEPGGCPSLGDGLRQVLLPDGNRYRPGIWKSFEPGTREHYSNVAICLAAYIVEVVSGEDFKVYCITHIFGPLGMESSSFSWSDLDMSKAVTLYLQNRMPIAPYDDQLYPGGSLKTSVEDFARFMMVYMNGGIYKGNRILSEQSINDILTLQNPATGKCLVWDQSAGNWYSHSGNVDGAGAHVDFQRDRKLGFMIVGNMTATPVYPGGQIYDIVRHEANRY